MPAQVLEDRAERAPGAAAVDEVVAELAELVEDHVGRVARELGALVVDLLDVALGAGRADDVGRRRHPALQPVEALAAHAGRQHGDAAAAEDARDGDAAATVVAGRGPHGLVARRDRTAGDEARDEAAIGGQHLVGADHREPAAERDDDARLDAGQHLGQLDVARQRGAPPPSGIVVPVHPEQVGRSRLIRVDGVQSRAERAWNPRRVGQLSERWQKHLRRAQALHRPAAGFLVDDLRHQVEFAHVPLPTLRLEPGMAAALSASACRVICLSFYS